jgi:hypothetical protein
VAEHGFIAAVHTRPEKQEPSVHNMHSSAENYDFEISVLLLGGRSSAG